MLLKDSKTYSSSFKGGSGANLRLVISDDDKYVVKSIERSEIRAAKLASQYEWLKSKQHLDHIVKVNRLHHEGSSARYTMEFLENYVPLNKYLLTSSDSQAKKILSEVLSFIEMNIHFNKVSVVSQNLFTHYLEKKLRDNVRQAIQNSDDLEELSGYSHLKINGKTYRNFEECYARIISHPEIIKKNSEHHLCDIHGDLTLENIFINEESLHFVLIDPNCNNLISSPLIDYSKLLQSTSSKYEIMQTLTLKREGLYLYFDEEDLRPDNITTITNELLRSRLSPEQFKNLEIYEAVNFSRILPYRLDLSPDNYLVYYCRLIVLLNQYLEGFE